MPIAIDFGTRAIHLVQGTAKKKQVTIRKAVIEPLPSGLFQDGIIREFSGMELALKNTLQKFGIRDRSCHVTINGNHIYTRDLVTPRGKPKVMQDVVKFEIQSAMNSTKEMAVDFVALKTPVADQPGMINVRASAVLSEYVNDYHKLLKSCRLSPASLDIHSNALLKAVAGKTINNQSVESGGSVMIIDMGGVTSSAYVYNRGEVIYSRIIPIGGLDLERFVYQRNEQQNGHGQVSIEQLDLSLETLRQDDALADALRPMVTTINDGVQRILQYLSSRLQDEKVSRIFLCGRTATYRGLDKTMAETFGLPTETIETISTVKMPANEPVAPYINAIGALIRLD